MAREKSLSVSMLQEFFDPGLYKRNQGRIARQVTGGAIALIVAIGAWRLNGYLVAGGSDKVLSLGLPVALLAIGWWTCYRIVNLPRFADFLIAVEGEMAKVSWPGRVELVRSSIVVILTIVILAVVLFAYDVIWSFLLGLLGVIHQ